ncbi:MAG TPA: hypothetical protein VFP60_06665 [Pseudolabrys sp.]|nr:hypothetical protein [Pseudolabrys sp.]
MTDSLPSQPQPHAAGPRDKADYQRRLKAAGLDCDDIPDDEDEFRRRLVRMIPMFLNQWHGCPERLCRRLRGCMAPKGTCTNRPPVSEEEEEERDRWRPAMLAKLRAVIEEIIARQEQGEQGGA